MSFYVDSCILTNHYPIKIAKTQDIVAYHHIREGALSYDNLSHIQFIRGYIKIFHKLAIQYISDDDLKCHLALSRRCLWELRNHIVDLTMISQWAEVFLRHHEKKPLFDHSKVFQFVVSSLAQGYANEGYDRFSFLGNHYHLN